jgi:hypothetical protein
VAATKNASRAILLAAAALPGISTAETPPEQTTLSIKYLDYKERQHNLDRIHVRSPSFDLTVPLSGEWSLRAGLVYDAISGATPRYHTAVSGASRFKEQRKAGDIAVTRYFHRSTVTLAAGRSTERDYDSNFASVRGTLSSEDNNTTWQFGAGVSNDTINPVNALVVDERKHTTDLMAGITQVLTQRDVVQAVLTHVRGRGYFTMPYKFVDNRPREKDQHTLLLRWNHHLDDHAASLRLSYRYFHDSYGMTAHTLGAELVKELPGGWTLVPSLRLHTQSAADFYFDPVYDKRFGPPFPPGYVFGSPAYLTADQRLSAFGAATFGIKVEKALSANTSIDIKFEDYKQRASWRQFGTGSPGLANLGARSIVVGVTHRW